jgi:hypothetical protein
MAPPRDDINDALDPHRAEELTAAAREIAAKLRARSITLTGHESAEQLSDLLDAVERWETAVEAAGGDLYVDEGGSQPDNPAFAIPVRPPHEAVPDYLERLARARVGLRRRGD